MSMRALNRKVAQCTLSWPSDCLGAGHGKVGIELWVGGIGVGIGLPLYAIRVLRSRLARSLLLSSYNKQSNTTKTEQTHTQTHIRDPRRTQTSHDWSQRENKGQLFQLIRTFVKKVGV